MKNITKTTETTKKHNTKKQEKNRKTTHTHMKKQTVEKIHNETKADGEEHPGTKPKHRNTMKNAMETHWPQKDQQRLSYWCFRSGMRE